MKDALKLALEALESGVKTTANRISWTEYDCELMEQAITAIKEALAQPKQEVDWKDQYEKQKRRAEMWLAKYEEVAGPAPCAVPLAQPEQEPCGGCGGSGWVPRDPDIGTDQECFNCNGSGTQPNEPEQEPVAFSCLRCVTPKKCAVHGCSPNTWPSEFSPKRPWVGLTDEEKQTIYQSMMWGPSIYGYADAIEATLKEKNT